MTPEQLKTGSGTSLFELTIDVEGKQIFKGFFAPCFPHPKNIHEALVLSGKKDLVDKVTNNWEQISFETWRQALVVNRKKHVLVMQEFKAAFYPTAPMFLAAYEPANEKK